MGEYGLQALEGGWLSAEALEAAASRPPTSSAARGRLYIPVFPHKSVTAIPLETRMGKGKGEPEYWAAVIQAGHHSCTRWPALPEAALATAWPACRTKCVQVPLLVARRPSV